MHPNTKQQALRLTNHLLKTAEQLIADGHEHAATLFLLTEGDKDYSIDTVILCPLPDAERSKEFIAYALGKIVEKYDAYIFLTEGWMVKTHKDEPKPVGRPINHPNRIETFQLHFVTKFGDELFRTWIIKRTGKSAVLEHDHDTEIPTTGRFSNFYEFSMRPTTGSH